MEHNTININLRTMSVEVVYRELRLLSLPVAEPAPDHLPRW